MTLLRSKAKTEQNSPIRHTGEGRYPARPWVPASAGTTESGVMEIQRRHTSVRSAPRQQHRSDFLVARCFVAPKFQPGRPEITSSGHNGLKEAGYKRYDN